MDLSVFQLCVVAGSLLLSAIVQTSVGFAAALLSMPLLLAAGIELPLAISLILVTSSLPNLIGIYKLRSDVDYEAIAFPALLRLVTLPIGFLLMVYASHNLNLTTIKQLIGIVVLAIVLVQWSLRIKPKEKLHPLWQLPAFGGSGFLQGSVGMPGPPMALWVTAHNWSARKARVFLFVQYFIGFFPHAILLAIFARDDFVEGCIVAVMAIPFILLGAACGLWIGSHINRQRLRLITLTLLIVISANAIAGPMLG